MLLGELFRDLWLWELGVYQPLVPLHILHLDIFQEGPRENVLPAAPS